MIHFSYAPSVKQTSYFLRLKNFFEQESMNFNSELIQGKNFVFITDIHEMQSQESFYIKIIEEKLSLFDSGISFKGFLVEDEVDFLELCEWLSIEIKNYKAHLNDMIGKNLLKLLSAVEDRAQKIDHAFEEYFRSGEIGFDETVEVQSHPYIPVKGQTPLYCKDKLYFVEGKTSDDNLINAYVYNLFNSMSDSDFESQNDSIKNTLNNSNFPMIFFNQDSEVVWFNQAFKDLGLNPSNLVLTDSQIVEVGDKKWRTVFRRGSVGALILLPQEESQSVQSNEDLGIISSSIAHELNNPLGGILAAIDVLLLDDHDQDTLEMLENAKKTVLRCKNLVGTFLGFSRKELIEKSEVLWKGSVDQAYELMRFRLIENNFNLGIEFQSERNFPIKCNSSVLTMVLYLIFNELVTEFAHENLVREDNRNEMQLQVLERGHRIDIHLPVEMGLTKISKSTLIEQLLFLLGLKQNKITKGLSLSQL